MKKMSDIKRGSLSGSCSTGSVAAASETRVLWWTRNRDRGEKERERERRMGQAELS